MDGLQLFILFAALIALLLIVDVVRDRARRRIADEILIERARRAGDEEGHQP